MDRQQRFEALTSIPESAAIRLAERILDGSLGESRSSRRRPSAW